MAETIDDEAIRTAKLLEAQARAIDLFDEVRRLDLVARQATPEEHQRAELLAALGTVQRQAGNAEYRDSLARAAELAEQLDDTNVLVQAAFGYAGAQTIVGDDDTKRVAAAALDRVGTDPTPTRARLLATLAGAHDGSREWQTRRDLSLQAVDAAGRSGNDATFVDVITSTDIALATPDRIDQHLVDVERAVALADGIGDPVLQARTRFILVWDRYQRCDVEGANAIIAESEEITQRAGLPHERWNVALLATGQLLLAGHVDDAEAANEQALQSGTAAAVPDALGAFGGLLYVIRWHQGRLDEIADFFLDFARDNPSFATLRAVIPSMLCELGRIDEAHERLVGEVAAASQFPYDVSWLNGMHDLLDAAATTGDRVAARTLVDRVIAGEYPIALNIYAHHPLISAGKGAPVNAQLMNPVPSVAGVAAVIKGTRHPHAAMLLLDFILSKEGQKIMASAEYFPAHPDVPSAELPRLTSTNGTPRSTSRRASKQPWPKSVRP